MHVTLKKYDVFKDAMAEDYLYDEDIFERYEEDGNTYERLKDVEYAKKVLDAYCEVERYELRHPERETRGLSDREIEKIAEENNKRWRSFGDRYYEMFRLVSAAHNTFVSHGIKHNELARLAELNLSHDTGYRRRR